MDSGPRERPRCARQTRKPSRSLRPARVARRRDQPVARGVPGGARAHWRRVMSRTDRRGALAGDRSVVARTPGRRVQGDCEANETDWAKRRHETDSETLAGDPPDALANSLAAATSR